MTTTAHLAVQQAIVSALQAAPAVASGAVYANRTRAISAQQPLAVVVRLERSDAATSTLHAHDWRTTLSVECYAKAATAASDPAQAVDALLVEVWARVAALQPAGLGLMGLDMPPAIGWDYDDGETPLVCATFRVTAIHRTSATSLQPWP